MLLLLLAVLAGAALAALPFRRGLRSPGARLAYLARAGAGILLAALLLDVPLDPARAPGPIVALDASASWARARDDSAFASALAEARRLAGRDTLWLLGDSLRPAPDGALTPRDARSDITPLRDRASALGRAVVLVTDGALDDPALVAQLPTGSRLEVRPGTARPDAALLGLDVPPVVVAGDTLAVTLRVGAGGAGAPAGALRLRLGARDVALLPLPALGPWEQREVREVLLPAAADGAEQPLVAVLTLPGDVEPRNDTLTTTLAVAERPSVIVASTAPDQDLRYAVAVLRGTLGLPVRAYVRVAPGTWRQDPGFAVATEAQVRTALAEAPIAVLHGDTALFGPPRTLARGALALLVPAPEDGAREGLLEGSLPGSPLAAALTGVPWDSLPPIALGPAPAGAWTALRARPVDGGQPRGLVAGGAQPRPAVVVAGSGFWRWAVREGAPADAHRAFWGAVFAWVGESGADAEPRRGGARDASLVTAPAEWLPHEAPPLPSPAATVLRPDIGRTLRDPWWPYLAVVLLLCADWVLRRRAGLR